MTQDIAKLFGEQAIAQAAALGKMNQMISDLVNAFDLDFRRRTRIPFSSRGLVKEYLVFRGPVLLNSLIVYNSSASTRYVQAFNGQYRVGDGSFTDLPPLPVTPGNVVAFNFEDAPFDQGLWLCGSSTDVVKTQITAPELYFYGLYRKA